MVGFFLDQKCILLIRITFTKFDIVSIFVEMVLGLLLNINYDQASVMFMLVCVPFVKY